MHNSHPLIDYSPYHRVDGRLEWNREQRRDAAFACGKTKEVPYQLNFADHMNIGSAVLPFSRQLPKNNKIMTFFRPLSRCIGNEWGSIRRMSSIAVSSSTRYIPAVAVSPKEIQAMALRMSANQHLLTSSGQRFISSKLAAEVASAEIATPNFRQLRIVALKAGIPVRKIITKLIV